jgi:glycosyltransferase involved in cell wall biosynthesis
MSECDLSPDRLYAVPMKGRFDRQVAKRIMHIVQAGGYRLLHAHTPRSAMIASIVSRRLSIPWLYHIHSPTARDSSRQLLNRVNDWMETWSLRNSSHLITVSRSLRREFLQRGFDRQKLTCIPNGVPELSEIDPWSRIEQSKWRLGMVALFRPRKGLEVLLEAMHLLSDLPREIEIEVIGGFETEDYRQSILSLIERYRLASKVSFTGFTKDIAGRLANLDGLVLPSLYGEGMPMVVLEALSAAVPVIATRVEGTPEVVRHRVEGHLAEPRDARSLANEISDFTADRAAWAKMSQQAVERHRQHFSDRRMAEKTASIYRRLLSKFPGQA